MTSGRKFNIEDFRIPLEMMNRAIKLGSPDTIKAKQTPYRGRLFRSRLEARWAFFFDEMEIRWEYETECFPISFPSKSAYLPDFWLPEFDQGVFVEVRHSHADCSDAIAFARQHNAAMWLCVGDPDFRKYDLYVGQSGPISVTPWAEGDKKGFFAFPDMVDSLHAVDNPKNKNFLKGESGERYVRAVHAAAGARFGAYEAEPKQEEKPANSENREKFIANLTPQNGAQRSMSKKKRDYRGKITLDEVKRRLTEVFNLAEKNGGLAPYREAKDAAKTRLNRAMVETSAIVKTEDGRHYKCNFTLGEIDGHANAVLRYYKGDHAIEKGRGSNKKTGGDKKSASKKADGAEARQEGFGDELSPTEPIVPKPTLPESQASPALGLLNENAITVFIGKKVDEKIQEALNNNGLSSIVNKMVKKSLASLVGAN